MSKPVSRNQTKFGYINSADIVTNIPITEASLLKNHYWSSSNKNAAKRDKTCIVCKKTDMCWQRYLDHLCKWHDLIMIPDGDKMDVEEVLEAKEIWDNQMEYDPPNPLPCDYNSEKEKMISEMTLTQRRKVTRINLTFFHFHSGPRREVLQHQTVLPTILAENPINTAKKSINALMMSMRILAILMAGW